MTQTIQNQPQTSAHISLEELPEEAFLPPRLMVTPAVFQQIIDDRQSGPTDSGNGGVNAWQSEFAHCNQSGAHQDFINGQMDNSLKK